MYDASVLVLTTRIGTVVYNLYQYQDTNSDCLFFPNPYLPRVLKNGKWVAETKASETHGVKWKLPSTLVSFFEQPNLIVTGRSIKGDVTRMNNVFCDPATGTPLVLKTWDISALANFEPWRTEKAQVKAKAKATGNNKSAKKGFPNSLSDWYVGEP